MKERLKVMGYLIDYALRSKLIESADVHYVTNRLLYLLKVPPQEVPIIESKKQTLDDIFTLLFTDAFKAEFDLEYPSSVEAFRAAIMDIFALLPSSVNTKFLVEEKHPASQLSNFHAYCEAIDYIKSGESFMKWDVESKYGAIEITINLSKPEKDPKEIAKLATLTENTSYPKCQLCLENVGNYGDLKHAARSNHRVLPLMLNHEEWSFQFSPYSYYDEHAIILKNEHTPMNISRETFLRLVDFINQYPHYFIGSNAGLPIVGGSILDHDHFQAGNYEFPMMRATHIKAWKKENMEIELLNWPLSVIRITTQSQDVLIETMSLFTESWETYSNEDLEIFAHTKDRRHHAVTPIVRKVGRKYEGYLAFRSNRVSPEYPDGIYHPHPEIHPVKKENIGLIEVMGYAILPGRLHEELNKITDCIIENNQWDESIEKHRQWVERKVLNSSDNKGELLLQLQEGAGEMFVRGLEHTNVFKNSKDAISFIEKIIGNMK